MPTTPTNNARAAKLLSLLAIAGVLTAGQSALAATYTWTGLGSGNNWRIGSNWSSVTNFPQVGDDIIFAGSVRPNPNNNNTAVQGVFSSITFDSTATNFLITGVAALTISNGITNNSVNTQTFNNPITLGSSNVNFATLSGNITMRQAVGDAGAGRGITKTGSATLTLTNTNTYTGATTISDGAVVLSGGGSLSTNSALDLAGATARFDIAGLTASGSTNASLAGVAGSVVNLGSKNFDVGGNNTSTTFAGTITNTGSLTKSGTGTLTLSGASANTYSGLTTISAGTLNLNKTAGVNAIAGATTINSGAVLLISASNQVDSGAGNTVTLSGGTIRRGGNVSEVFGDLNVSAASFLDFGAANAAGTLSFGTYTASALLTVQNFLPGNKLQFASGFNAALLPTGGSLSNTNFSFSNGFTTGTEDGYFTITAIPEPSTFLAALGLLAMALWRCAPRRGVVRSSAS